MSDLHSNQHYVSQVLLRRFADSSGYLERFCLKTKKWKRKSPRSVFSRLGYNQLLVDGKVYDEVDKSLKEREDALPIVLSALDAVANGGNTQLDSHVYKTLFSYCAHLWCISPFAKSVAPVNYLVQLHSDLTVGRTDLLKLVGIDERNFPAVLNLHAKGARFILRGEDYLQTVFWVNFRNKYNWEFDALRHHVRWGLYRSPIEMPVPDVAFLQFEDKALKGNTYLLPVSPNLILVGKREYNVRTERYMGTEISFGALSQREAEYYRDAICLSGITAIACNTRQYDILAVRQQAIARGIHFATIKNLDAALSAGTKECKSIVLWPTTGDEFAKYIKSYIEN